MISKYPHKILVDANSVALHGPDVEREESEKHKERI